MNDVCKYKETITECERIAKKMFEQILSNMGEDYAYDWADKNISSDWRYELGIVRPRKYDVIEVTFNTKIVVPNNISYDEIASIVFKSMQPSDLSIEELSDDMNEEEIRNSSYIIANSTSDFDDWEWYK